MQQTEKRSSIAYSCYTMRRREKEQFITDHVLSYQISGRMIMYDGDSEYIFDPGTLRLGSRNRLIKYNKLPPEGGEYKSFSVQFNQTFLRNLSLETGYKAEKHDNTIPVIRLTFDPLFKEYFNSLPLYAHIKEAEDSGLIALKLREAILLLLKFNPDVKDILFDFREPGKIELDAFMNKNFHFNVGIERFAYLTGRSLSGFKRDFKDLYNLTPSRWLQRRRLQEAFYLIVKKGKTASAIYLDLGFNDLSHFSFAFKKQFGASPSKIAKQMCSCYDSA
jgi:AraC-like DNA-binding protein